MAGEGGEPRAPLRPYLGHGSLILIEGPDWGPQADADHVTRGLLLFQAEVEILHRNQNTRDWGPWGPPCISGRRDLQ